MIPSINQLVKKTSVRNDFIRKLQASNGESRGIHLVVRDNGSISQARVELIFQQEGTTYGFITPEELKDFDVPWKRGLRAPQLLEFGKGSARRYDAHVRKWVDTGVETVEEVDPQLERLSGNGGVPFKYRGD